MKICLYLFKTFNEERIFETFGNEATKHGDFGSYLDIWKIK